MRPTDPKPLLLLLSLCAFAGAGCSAKKAALRSVADGLSAGSSGSFARDDDPELIRAATPFALKTMESLADELDDHVGLRRSLASGFTQYAYAFVQTDADELGDKEPQKAQALRTRASRLYRRARDYGLEGLFIRHKILVDDLRNEQKRPELIARLEKEDVPLVYWTLVPWAAAIAANKRDLELVGDVPVVAALLDRALELDESYDLGALHEFSLAFDPARPGGTTPEKQRAHFDRAVALSAGRKVSVFVSWAENVLIPAQDKAGFEKVLNDALSFDVDEPRARDQRLANVLAQRRAKWLLAHVEDLIL